MKKGFPISSNLIKINLVAVYAIPGAQIKKQGSLKNAQALLQLKLLK